MTTARAAESAGADRATVDLLGVLAYGELSAFDRLAEDARAAPTLPGRAALSVMAAAEIGHFRLLEEHLRGLGVPVEDAMAPFVGPLDSYHASTAPRSWLESLVKAYVGDGLAADFYREIAGWLPGPTGELVQQVLAPGTARSPSARCARPARPTARCTTGSPCGGAGCSARRSPRPSTSWPSATSWPTSSSPAPAT
jgi:hypothetical protein